jgi:predicted enzyme related to lactoylglutathione lyase
MERHMTHTAGTFCTALLHTRDVASASRFYGTVFGWEFHDNAAPCFRLRGQRVAGIRHTRGDANLWVPYVAVDNIEVTRDAAASTGGTVMDTAVPSGHQRQFAVIKDPEGAVFGLCATDAPDVVTLTEGPGTIWWVELLTHVPAAITRFYRDLLNWHFTEQPLEPHPLYVTWMRGDQRVGGLLPIGPGWNTPPRWQVLFQVDDLDAAVARTVNAGGIVEFGPLDVPRAGTLTSVRDPNGALHVLVQPRRGAT